MKNTQKSREFNKIQRKRNKIHIKLKRNQSELGQERRKMRIFPHSFPQKVSAEVKLNIFRIEGEILKSIEEKNLSMFHNECENIDVSQCLAA